VRANRSNSAVAAQLQHHRVIKLCRSDASFAAQQRNSVIRELIDPPQTPDAPVDGGKERSKISLAADNKASEDRGNEFCLRWMSARCSVEAPLTWP
jgi:hypothetical protein